MPLDLKVYCGGIEIQANQAVIFAPSLYVLKTGSLRIAGNAHVSNTENANGGVTFYLTGSGTDYATLDFEVRCRHHADPDDHGTALGQRIGHANSLAFALSLAAGLDGLRRAFEAARKWAEAAIEIAREHRLPQWLAFGSMCRGFALVGLGQQREGIAQL